MKHRKLLSLLAASALLLSMAGCGTPAAPTTEDNAAATEAPKTEAPAATEAKPAETKAADAAPAGELTELTFLMDWNGGAGNFPDGFTNGQVAKAIQEKTGVILKVETITSSETEKLAMIFASDDVPDITNGPFWSTDPGGEGEQIKNAAMNGQLLGLNQYIDKYPNIKKAMTEGISKAFVEKHLESPDFNGERYIIPRKPGTDEDVTNWAYGVYARKDILEKLAIKPESVTNPTQLRELLEKIKAGGFTDINGKPVIPAGNWHNGWSYDQFVLGFEDGGFTTWGKADDSDLIVPREMRQAEIDRTLYMRKLVADGLYDAEAFNQTDTMGKEKMATGRIATFGCHWPHMNGFFESTLYLTNPEMEYLPLGPFVQLDGSNPTTVARKGAFGFGCLFLGAKVKDPDKALGLIEFLSTKEGQLLCKFGIEGVHYDMNGEIPVRKEEWVKIKSEDAQKYNLEGFGYGELCTDDFMKSWGWDQEYNKPGWVHAREIRKLALFDGYSIEDYARLWPGRAAYDEALATVDYAAQKKIAMTAKSDEEAIAIIEARRKQMKDAGYDEMIKYANDEKAKDPATID